MLNTQGGHSFRDRLAKILEALDLTQQDFAWALGISFVTVSRWMSGDQVPSKFTDMVIRTIEIAIRQGKGSVLSEAIKERRFKGGSPEAMKLISEAAFTRS
jgi:transcriptional regulator with XRE-family HTH domain